MPASCGAASEPRAVAETRTSPATSAARLARRGLARPSGSEPETLASRPGPGEGDAAGALEVEPARRRWRGPRRARRRRRGSCRSRWGRRAGRGSRRGRRRSALRRGARSRRRVGERPGGAAGAADRAAQAAAAGGAVDEREREGLESESNVELALRRAGPSRWRVAASPVAETTRAQVEPAVRGGAAWRRAATGGRPAARVTVEASARGLEVEAHVRRVARAGDAGGAVDGAGEAEVGADGVGEVERKVADARRRCRSCRRPCPARSGCRSPKWRPSGVSSTAPPRMVTVAGAVRVAARPCWRRRSVSSVAAKPPSSRVELAREVGERADGEAGCRRRSASSCASVWSAVALSEAISKPATARSVAVSVPLISGRPSASATVRLGVERADAVGADHEVASPRASSATPWPTLGGVERDVGVERAASPRPAPARRAARCRGRRA